MTTYEKHLYGVTGSTQGADADTHVLKAKVEYMYTVVRNTKNNPQINKKKQLRIHNYETIIRLDIRIF